MGRLVRNPRERRNRYQPNQKFWLNDPAWKQFWIADSTYFDSTVSPSVWSPRKGTINLIQPSAGIRPVYSATYGSQNRGVLAFNGVDQFMSADALAAYISGASGGKPYTLIMSLRVNVVASAAPWGFSQATLGTLIAATLLTAGLNWSFSAIDDASAQFTPSAATPGTTARIVLTHSSNGTNPQIRVNGAPTTVSGFSGGTFPQGGMTLTKFIIGGTISSGAIAPAGPYFMMNCSIRALAFADSLLPLSMPAAERYLLADAA